MQQRRIGFKQRASQIILQVPVDQIRRIKETEGIGSISRETQHFSQTTTMHGPKRIYQGKRFSTYFWMLMMMGSGILLIYQVATLITMYVSNPIVSQVSFLISENGMDFPMVTMCNFNPIKKSYIRKLNATGDFSDELLDYLMESLMDTKALYSNADRAELHVGDRALQIYQEQHPNFTINGFFSEAGYVMLGFSQ
ncbi:hypothetical protein RB195_005156 [Necator americanus]|uniref:Uncharacterized protein n=2 Tax=Necator americanus TaxID=51031 RepID=W2T5E5_NECAM|nr:hypothetical protein NECAME_11712 [Necator americanus]ETN76406.1 hypothetical protein NECAME_11712 [Necator americanus]